MHPYRHFHLLSHPGKDRHQSVDGEAAEVRIAYAREVGGGDAGQLLRGPHGQLAVIEHATDLCRKQCTQLLAISVGIAEIAEDVATAPDDVHVVAHRSLSHNRCSRSRTRSMSCFGVLIPDFDFSVRPT